MGHFRPSYPRVRMNTPSDRAAHQDTQEVLIHKLSRAAGRVPPAVRDAVAREEPLEIRINQRRFCILMRTPGHDLELTSGLLVAENIIHGPRDVHSISHCLDEPESSRDNVVQVGLDPALQFDPNAVQRNLFSSSSCGLCGRDTIEALATCHPPVEALWKVSTDLLTALPGQLQKEQRGFARTGGLHAAALFDLEGRLLVGREDVGRHNAVDKVIGAALRHDLLPLSRCFLFVSGRISFEIVQKARAAGLPLIAAVSAPTSLAVELARSGNQTLAAFVRDDRLNVYCGLERIGP